MRSLTAVVTAICLSWASTSQAFTVRRSLPRQDRVRVTFPPKVTPRTHSRQSTPTSSSSTALNLLLDVPDYFFTVSFPVMHIILTYVRKISRIRLEENAWEQRLAEARAERLRNDPSLTELDIRRQEAEMEWSAYGKPSNDDRIKPQVDLEGESKYARKRVRVMDREADQGTDEETIRSEYRMTDEEIKDFELEYGIDYDPYYDDPYTIDELPEGKFNVDKKYGDRFYENGEIFFLDAESGLFYRQGAKPRKVNIWA